MNEHVSWEEFLAYGYETSEEIKKRHEREKNELAISKELSIQANASKSSLKGG